ncbi:catalysis At the Interface: the anatomy of A conformational change in A triglyceride lipase [Fennellomyces sp. T-0311]|nr:catalysis At the Interface: the anatomy of A conformational change in A triglyceride lipase [Fennellomyces sp. T-0311]
MKFSFPLALASYFALSSVTAYPLFEKRHQANSTDDGTNGVSPLAIPGIDYRFATAAEETLQRYYMTLAGNAYCPTVIPGGVWNCPNCHRTDHIEIIQTFTTPEHDTNAMVVRDDDLKRIVAVFRGSASSENWAANLDAVLTNYPHALTARVHRGFYNSYQEVAGSIIPVITQQVSQYPDYTLAVTGHSLGGATSLLCALDLHQRGFRPSLFTQGAPRVGNLGFARYIVNTNIPYTRLTNKRDLIVDVPSRLSGFWHAGEEFWIRSDNRIQVCPNGLETSDCANSVTLLKNMADHLNYFDLTSSGSCPSA